jgi:hypothetical protein
VDFLVWSWMFHRADEVDGSATPASVAAGERGWRTAYGAGDPAGG